MAAETQSEANGTATPSVPEQPRDAVTGQFTKKQSPLEDLRDFGSEETPPAPEAPEPTQATAAPSHTARLVERARFVGLDPAQYAGTPSEQFENIVSHLEQRELQLARQWREDRAHAPVGNVPAPEPEPIFKSKITPEREQALDPELVALMRENERELHEIKAELIRERRANEAARQETQANRWEQAFATRPDLFGAGTASDLNPSSPQMALRHAVSGIMQGLPPGGTFRQRFDYAVSLLGGRPQQAVPASNPQVDQALQQRTQQWAQNGTAPPTQRQSKPLPKGVDKAKQTFLQRSRDLAQSEAQEEVGNDEIQF